MRVNVYAEEMTDRVEIISKNVEGHEFTAVRFYLALPATGPDGTQHQGPFIHRPGDDDSAAVTFWGKRDLRPMLRRALDLLDKHYAPEPEGSACADRAETVEETHKRWAEAPKPLPLGQDDKPGWRWESPRWIPTHAYERNAFANGCAHDGLDGFNCGLPPEAHPQEPKLYHDGDCSSYCSEECLACKAQEPKPLPLGHPFEPSFHCRTLNTDMECDGCGVKVALIPAGKCSGGCRRRGCGQPESAHLPKGAK